MAIITIDDARLYARLDPNDNAEDTLLLDLVRAAQAHIERHLGFQIEATYGGAGQDPVPEDLKQAVRELTVWWFDNRMAADEARTEMPFGVRQIVAEYRGFTF